MQNQNKIIQPFQKAVEAARQNHQYQENIMFNQQVSVKKVLVGFLN